MENLPATDLITWPSCNVEMATLLRCKKHKKADSILSFRYTFFLLLNFFENLTLRGSGKPEILFIHLADLKLILQPASAVLVVAKPGSNWCKQPIKGAEEDKTGSESEPSCC